MSTTTTVKSINVMKGFHQGSDLRALEVAVLVDGTYATASKPNFDVLAALQTQHFNVTPALSSLQVAAAVLWQDGNDGTNRYTAPNSQIALSGTGNKVVTFRIDSGATDGLGGGSEITDSTALHHVFSFLVVASFTS